MTLTATVIDAPDAHGLADFYRRLLGWEVEREDEDWVVLHDPDGEARLSFQTETGYTRPAWPARLGDQQMMMHLDIEVDDLDAASEHACAEGAVLSDHQPQDGALVHLDPAGHPFCLWTR